MIEFEITIEIERKIIERKEDKEDKNERRSGYVKGIE